MSFLIIIHREFNRDLWSNGGRRLLLPVPRRGSFVCVNTYYLHLILSELRGWDERRSRFCLGNNRRWFLPLDLFFIYFKITFSMPLLSFPSCPLCRCITQSSQRCESRASALLHQVLGFENASSRLTIVENLPKCHFTWIVFHSSILLSTQYITLCFLYNVGPDCCTLKS